MDAGTLVPQAFAVGAGWDVGGADDGAASDGHGRQQGQLKPGDQVTGTIWRRTIVALSKDGVRQHTSEAPRDELQMNAALGLLAGLLAALTFVFGAVRLVRPRSPEPFTWDPYGRRMLITVLSACFGAGLLTVWAGIPWPTVPAVVVPVVAYAAGVMYRGLHHGVAGRT
ncbi:hypothetical protein RKE30_25855 [Streptomyces sp. Li-HN-5-11]|uniref:hypothetical protein n=1 Tax=Streptomyces sp. Li-HN-5-11 TaxID=3075432 RepID=UPI0028B0BB17|nr:hypothetical protein [Streptomyces sp. Li-HN-5-11]WNM33572.1 hypothetical protein RKE30_25855 [Streptomyces sp. Li-HN-5-11]